MPALDFSRDADRYALWLVVLYFCGALGSLVEAFVLDPILGEAPVLVVADLRIGPVAYRGVRQTARIRVDPNPARAWDSLSLQPVQHPVQGHTGKIVRVFIASAYVGMCAGKPYFMPSGTLRYDGVTDANRTELAPLLVV